MTATIRRVSFLIVLCLALTLMAAGEFETIISDSFISHYDVGAFSDKDSSEFRFTIEVLQK